MSAADDRADAATLEVDLEVRNYECDLQGIVNNAVFLNYLEHARHQYLLSVGIDWPFPLAVPRPLLQTALVRGEDRLALVQRLGHHQHGDEGLGL